MYFRRFRWPPGRSRIPLRAFLLGWVLTVGGAPALVSAPFQTADVRFHAYTEISDPSAFGPVDALYAAIVRDYTLSGAPTPDLLVLENIRLLEVVDPADPNADPATFLAADFENVADGFPEPSEIGGLIMDVGEIPDLGEDAVVFGALQTPGTLTATPRTSLGSFFEGASGDVLYEAQGINREVSFNLNSDSGNLAGDSTYTVVSSERVEIDSWATELYEAEAPRFDPAGLNRLGILYFGELIQRDPLGTLEWFDRFGFISIEDDLDTDGDGIPDFGDTGVTLSPFFADMELGNNWYFASWMDSAVLPTPQSWYLTTAHQWLYAPNGQVPDGVWFYSPQGKLEWFWTREDLYPYLFRASSGDFVYYHWEDENGDRMVSGGEAFLYDYRSESWEPLQF